MDTPISYARSIAYLGDASTVRARTRDEFGRAPPLFVCERIVEERKAKAKAFRQIAERRKIAA